MLLPAVPPNVLRTGQDRHRPTALPPTAIGTCQRDSAVARKVGGTFDVMNLDSGFSNRIILPDDTSRFALYALDLAFDDSIPLTDSAHLMSRLSPVASHRPVALAIALSSAFATERQAATMP